MTQPSKGGGEGNKVFNELMEEKRMLLNLILLGEEGRNTRAGIITLRGKRGGGERNHMEIIATPSGKGEKTKTGE